MFHVKHRKGGPPCGGKLKERRFRAEIIYFLVCCHFLFAVKGSVLWRRCGRKMGRAAATPGRPKPAGVVRTLGDVCRTGGRSHAGARCPTARTASREGSPETDAMRTLWQLLAVKISGNARRSRPESEQAARLGRFSRHPPDGGLWLRRRPEQAQPDAARKKGGHPAMSALNGSP